MVRTMFLAVSLIVAVLAGGCLDNRVALPDQASERPFERATLLATVADDTYGFPILSGSVHSIDGYPLAEIHEGRFELQISAHSSVEIDVSAPFFCRRLVAITADSPAIHLAMKLSPSPATDHLHEFAQLVTAEAEGEPYEGQVAVAATVLNRVNHSDYPDNIHDVIFQTVDGYTQYSPVEDGRIDNQPNELSRRAVFDALRGRDPSGSALGFYNPAKTENEWIRQQPITTVIGNHVFWTHEEQQ